MKRPRSDEITDDLDRTLSSPATDSPFPAPKRPRHHTNGHSVRLLAPDTPSVLDPAYWLLEKTGTHVVADMALRMLWSWVTPHATTPATSVRDMANTWFATRSASGDPAETARIARALVIDSPVEYRPAHTSTRPRLYWAHWRGGPPDRGVVIKWHPFFEEGRDEYEWLAHRTRGWALKCDAHGRSLGMTARYEPLLAFTLDVLHGKWLAQLPAELSAHVATTLDAMALPRFHVKDGVATASVGRGTGLYAVMERGDATLFEHAVDHGADGHLFASVRWQAFFALYVLGVHAGWTHEDAHPRNIMFKQAPAPWAGRDWLYVLPDVDAMLSTSSTQPPPCRYYVLPACVHGDKMAKLIDFGRSRLDPDVDAATLDKRLRYDFQLLLHGHLRAHEFHDPLTVPRHAFQLKTSIWAGAKRVPLAVRRGLVRTARRLCDPATKVHAWPTWVAPDLPVQGPYASLDECMAAFPGTLVLAGALTSTRRGTFMDPRHEVARALTDGRLTRGVTR